MSPEDTSWSDDNDWSWDDDGWEADDTWAEDSWDIDVGGGWDSAEADWEADASPASPDQPWAM